MDLTNVKAYYFRVVPSLTEEIWEEMKPCFVSKQLNKGEFYIQPGEVENYVSFINSGGLKASYLHEEKEVIIDLVFENNYFSEYQSFLTQSPCKSCIQALEDTELIKLSYQDVQRFYEIYPTLQKFGRLIAEYLFTSISGRTSSLLLETAEARYKKIVDRNPKLLQRVPQYMIASYIGVTPEALSRIRKRIAF
jgi:CRP-like cAMP-binding protein